MSWYIVYKGKTHKCRNSLKQNLDRAQIPYYTAIRATEHVDGEQIIVREEDVLHNLIFIKTDEDIYSVTQRIDGLRSPYRNQSTGLPAVVSDEEMQRFMEFMQFRNTEIRLLQQPYQHFSTHQRVRVRAGQFEGIEGYVLRMRGDRKLVVSLGEMAMAVSGIHHTLLEPIHEEES